MDILRIMQQLAACMGTQDKLLLCCAGDDAKLLEAAVSEAGFQVVNWEPDLRWQNLVRLAILNKTRVAVGPAVVLLALSKLGKATAAPIPIRNVILTGPSCPEWMKESIAGGLDAQVWDCCEDWVAETDPALDQMAQELLRWSSVLDYRAQKTEMGLSLELVVFPGKKLPQLPSGAKVTARPWAPASDKPFSVI